MARFVLERMVKTRLDCGSIEAIMREHLRRRLDMAPLDVALKSEACARAISQGGEVRKEEEGGRTSLVGERILFNRERFPCRSSEPAEGTRECSVEDPGWLSKDWH